MRSRSPTARRRGRRRESTAASRRHLRVRDLVLEGAEHVRNLLVDDRLEDALAHAADRARDMDVGDPLHARAVALERCEVELGVHPDDRAHALAARVQLRVLDRALVGLLELGPQLQAAHAQRHFDVRRPVLVVLDLEPFDARQQLRDARGVHEDVPDGLRRGVELLGSFDLHVLSTSTRALLSSGFAINRHTRSAGLWLSETTPGIPALRSASWMAAQTAWMAAPPPSPIPFVPSEENGDGLSM